MKQQMADKYYGESSEKVNQKQKTKWISFDKRKPRTKKGRSISSEK